MIVIAEASGPDAWSFRETGYRGSVTVIDGWWYSDDNGDYPTGLRVTELPDNGVLFLDIDGDNTVDPGEAIALNQEIDWTAASGSRMVKFAPDTDWYGTTTLTYAIRDWLEYGTPGHVTIRVKDSDTGGSDSPHSHWMVAPSTLWLDDPPFPEDTLIHLKTITSNASHFEYMLQENPDMHQLWHDGELVVKTTVLQTYSDMLINAYALYKSGVWEPVDLHVDEGSGSQAQTITFDPPGGHYEWHTVYEERDVYELCSYTREVKTEVEYEVYRYYKETRYTIPEHYTHYETDVWTDDGLEHQSGYRYVEAREYTNSTSTPWLSTSPIPGHENVDLPWEGTGDFRPFISGEQVPWRVAYTDERGYEHVESPMWEQPASWWLAEFQDKGDPQSVLGDWRETLLVGVDGGKEQWQDVPIVSSYDGIQVETEKRTYWATELQEVPSTRKVGTELIAHKERVWKEPTDEDWKEAFERTWESGFKDAWQPSAVTATPGTPGAEARGIPDFPAGFDDGALAKAWRFLWEQAGESLGWEEAYLKAAQWVNYLRDPSSQGTLILLGAFLTLLGIAVRQGYYRGSASLLAQDWSLSEWGTSIWELVRQLLSEKGQPFDSTPVEYIIYFIFEQWGKENSPEFEKIKRNLAKAAAEETAGKLMRQLRLSEEHTDKMVQVCRGWLEKALDNLAPKQWPHLLRQFGMKLEVLPKEVREEIGRFDKGGVPKDGSETGVPEDAGATETSKDHGTPVTTVRVPDWLPSLTPGVGQYAGKEIDVHLVVQVGFDGKFTSYPESFQKEIGEFLRSIRPGGGLDLPVVPR